LTAELYEFHEVVDHMQEEEEAVIDAHRELIEVVSGFFWLATCKLS